MNFFHSDVSLGRQTQILRLGVDDDQHRVRMISSYQLVDGNIISMQLGTCVIPPNNPFSSYEKNDVRFVRSFVRSARNITVDFAKHRVHILQIFVIKKPNIFLFLFFIEWH